MASAFRAYSQFLSQRPFAGNMATSAVGTPLLLRMNARVSYRPHADQNLSLVRLYSLLEMRWVNMSKEKRHTMWLVGLDQFVAAPTIISTFFMVMSRMEGKSWQDGQTKIKSTLFPTLQVNWMLFIPVQGINLVRKRVSNPRHKVADLCLSHSRGLVNFCRACNPLLYQVVPLQYRGLVINAVNIPWNAYLSMQNSAAGSELGSGKNI
ncbi:hypothetical protein QFC22_003673 [Naganishia vaughanmartiniae]|uniref:Uncharacterized protein n=1 Tax=Naganishia vaughanmartiniae TaxID=1424756 RepID=A0ACC2X6A2_9TREE|nr:hypothetical protein QFC22_003673 [Naganishia vaughanmartiniae]